MKLEQLKSLFSLLKTPDLFGRYITNSDIEKCLKKIRKEKATMPKKVLKKPKKRLVDDRQKDERTIIERKEEYTYSYDIHVDKCTTLPECSSDSDTGSE